MKSRLILALAAVLAIAVGIAPSAFHGQRASAAVSGITLPGLNRIQQRILSGFALFEDNIGVPPHSASATVHAAAKTAGPAVSLCPSNIRSNVVVNQNCLNISDPALQGRGQAENETTIAENPSNPRQIVGGFNDYRRGDGNCYGAFSGNGGRAGPTPRCPWHSPAGRPSAAWHASTGRPAATRPWPGTRRATPTSHARCSSAAVDHEQPGPVKRGLPVPLHR